MADILGQFGRGLQGFSAGSRGQLPQLLNQQNQARQLGIQEQQQAQQQQQSLQEEENLQAQEFLRLGHTAFGLAEQGQFGRIAALWEKALQQGLAPKLAQEAQNMMGMAQRAAQGDQEAASALTGFLSQGASLAIDSGVIQPPEQPKQQIVGGQVVTLGDTPTATDIQGFDQQAKQTAIGTEQGFFESLLEQIPDEKKKKKAVEIKLGLKAKPVSNAILSAIASGDITNLADAKAQIRQAEKFAEATGTSRARTIDKGFESITKIDAGVRNIDRAIEAIRAGAGVGAIEKNFPSLRAASIALDNIQGSMALDVVGATTFGALSKGELDLARQVALPTGLETDDLIKHLQDKKAAQAKLRAYYGEQIQFLDQGGTVAGFLRKKESEQGDSGQASPTGQTGPAAQVLQFDAQGNPI